MFIVVYCLQVGKDNIPEDLKLETARTSISILFQMCTLHFTLYTLHFTLSKCLD